MSDPEALIISEKNEKRSSAKINNLYHNILVIRYDYYFYYCLIIWIVILVTLYENKTLSTNVTYDKLIILRRPGEQSTGHVDLCVKLETPGETRRSVAPMGIPNFNTVIILLW